MTELEWKIDELSLLTDLDKEIVITHWDSISQAEMPICRISKRDLIQMILNLEEDVMFIHDVSCQ